MSRATPDRPASEAPIPLVRGTSDWLPADHARLAELEARAFELFSSCGYDRLSTPVLDPVELHERKSGAGIVGKLFDLAGHSSSRVCLRPELTAGIVRAYTAAEPPPALPWRVSHAGPAFRRESPGRADRLREFRQVGLERLGDSGPFADAEVIWLAISSLGSLGLENPTVRLGHVGLTLEILGRSGLPPAAQSALVEMLSEAAAEGGDVGSLGRGLDHFSEWLRQASGLEEISLPVEGGDDAGVDRLFRTLVPVINGRRPGHEIIHRLRRKWDHGHGWLEALDRVRDQVRALADLKGPPGEILDRLARDFESLAPDSVASLRALIRSLGDHGVDPDRLELDLGFGRGIGFYSRMIFEVVAPTPGGPVEVCGGGRYDGLARVLGSDRDDRGVGFAFGLERVDEALTAQGHRASPRPRSTILVVPSSSEVVEEAMMVASLIRSNGSRAIVEAAWQGRGIAERARSLGAGLSVVVGDPEAEGPLMLLDHPRQTSRPTSFEELPRLFAAVDEEQKP